MQVNNLEGIIQELDTFDEPTQSLKCAQCISLPQSALEETVSVRFHISAFCFVLKKQRRQLGALLIGDIVSLPSSMTDTFEPCAIMGKPVDVLLL